MKNQFQLGAPVFCMLALSCSAGVVDLGEGELQDAAEAPLPLTAGAQCTNSTSISGPITVQSQAGVDALAGCQVIDGDLTIDPFDGADLRPLQELHTIRGILTFHPMDNDGDYWLDSLAGLEALRQVDSLLLFGLSVPDLQPLDQLAGVLNTLVVVRCPQLKNLHGLEGVTVVSYLSLARNEALTSLEGLTLGREMSSLNLTSLPALTELGTASPIAIGELLILQTQLATLDDFSTLEWADALWLVGNESLVDADALDGLVRVRTMILENNATLTALPAFSHLSGLSQLSVRNHAALEALPSFAGLAAAPALEPRYALINRPEMFEIEGNPRLTHIAAPSGWNAALYVSVADNQGLTTLSSGGLGAVDLLSIVGNPNLETLEADALRTVDRLEVKDNPKLSTGSFDGVQSFAREMSGNAAP